MKKVNLKLVEQEIENFIRYAECDNRAKAIVTEMKRRYPGCEGAMNTSEINFSATLSASKGGAQATGSASGTADLSGTEMISSVQSTSTTGAAISYGGCDQIQALYVRNMDSSIAVTIGLTNGNPPTDVVSVLPAGKPMLLWGVGTLYVASASGTPDIFVVAIET